MAANVVISAAGRCPAAAGEAREETNGEKRKIGFCLIVFGGLSLGVVYGCFIKGVTKKHDGPVRVVLVEAFAGRFAWLGESDIRPRHFQTRRIGGPGRG